MSEDRAARPPSPPQHFRLNLEQQKKRAKDLLRAVKAGEPEALARVAAHRENPGAPQIREALTTTTRLADAQFDSGIVWRQLVDHKKDGGEEVVWRQTHDLSEEKRAVLHYYQPFCRELDKRESRAEGGVRDRLARLRRPPQISNKT